MTTAREWLMHLWGVGQRGSTFLVLAALVAVLLHRRSAGARHLVWGVGLGGLGLVTVLSPLLPAWHLETPPVRTLSLLLINSIGGTGVVPSSAGAPGLAAAHAAGTSREPFFNDWIFQALAGLWATGVLVLIARLVVGLRSAAAVVAASQPIADRRLRAAIDEVIDEGVQVRLSTLPSPMCAGIFRMTVLLPADAPSWDPERLRAVLAHEYAHVRRRDCATQLFARLVVAFHWWNPLVWLAERRLLVERELACDDHVLAMGTRPSAYARHLITMSERRVPGTTAPVGAHIVGCSSLATRLKKLLDGGRSHKLPTRRVAVLLSGAVALLALPVACLTGDSLEHDRTSRLVYRTDPANQIATVAVLSSRIEGLGFGPVEVRSDGAGRIVVALPAMSGAARSGVRAALERPGVLRLTVVDNDSPYGRRLAKHVQGDAFARSQGLATNTEEWKVSEKMLSFSDTFVQGPSEALRKYVQTLPASLQPDAHHALLIDGDDQMPQMSRTLLVDRGRTLALLRLADATVIPASRETSEMFEVNVTLSPEDAERIKILTGANVGRKLALQLDGDLWGAPTIRSEFGPKFRVTARGSLAEADRLAKALRAGTLPSAIELVAP